MYRFFFFLGIVLLIILFLWKRIKMHHYKAPIVSSSHSGTKNSSGKTPEEYRKLAKQYLREKRFEEAEECYAKAKELEEN